MRKKTLRERTGERGGGVRDREKERERKCHAWEIDVSDPDGHPEKRCLVWEIKRKEGLSVKRYQPRPFPSKSLFTATTREHL